MGSRIPKDGESPSSSTVFLPQLRHSRRASIASLSSVNQIDKETLSQALDQIHNVASQSETLTTFNEFTAPPPSSSVIDSKGIASDLQGGISGLYSIFRASVGNTKDALGVGNEEDAAERLSVRSLTKSSPSPSIRGATPAHAVHQSPGLGSDDARAGIHQPLTSSSIKKSSLGQPALDGGQESLKVPVESEVTTGPASPNLPFLIQAEDVDLRAVGGKSNAGAAKRINVSTGIVPTGDIVKVGSSSVRDQTALIRGTTIERPTALRKFDSTSTKSSLVRQVSQSHKLVQSPASGDQALGDAENKEYQPPTQIERPSPTIQMSRTQAYLRKTSVDMTGTDNKKERSPYLVDESLTASTSKPVVVTGQMRDDAVLPDQTYKATANETKGKLPHLDLTSRKSMAPPLVSHTVSPGRQSPRASSIDTNSDGSNNASQRLLERQSNEKNKTPSRALPVTQATLRRDPRIMNSFSQSRNKVLNKEYWMKDENARDCYNCGEAFSTFRRKHHCRICGQIFDSKCTSIVSGERFGQSGPLRLCKPCEVIVYSNDDISDISDDGSLTVPSFRPRHGSTAGSDRGDIFASPQPSANQTDRHSFYRNPGPPDLTVPTMSIPATRKAGEKASRKSTVLEIGGSHTLARPSSSRSLKSSFSGRPLGGGHRRLNSRALQRAFKSVREDEAPFHQDVTEHSNQTSRLPAFHDDNIIDPDLAPYLSEEGSSGDEQMSIMAALHGDGLSKSYDNERHALPGLISSSRKGRSRLGDNKSMSAVAFAGRDSDNHSLHSAKIARSAKRRNLSFSGSSYLRPSSRAHRATLASPGSGLNLHNFQESISSPSLVQMNPSANQTGGIRMTRSSSMKGEAAPAIELNSASLQHVKKLLHQLLVDSKVPNIANWEKALVPILLRATDDVNPDVQGGDDIDIRHYVKLKKIPGGRPGDTSYVSGLVFTKNLALKSMPRSIAHPNILILTFPLEYRQQHHFMSLEPVIRQEREYLQTLVNRIAVLRPHLLLVERNVSGLALEFLAHAKIATAYNVKSSVLEAVSRCCQTRIVSSTDKLTIMPAHPSKCANFYLKTYVNKGRKKTYMFLSGCAKELGCTVVLRGDDEATLSRIKRITEFMTYVVYNLKLETCLMRDEYASTPVIVGEGSLSTSKEHAPRAKLPEPSNIKQANANATTAKVAHSFNTPAVPSIDRDESNALPTLDNTRGDDDKENALIALPEEDSVPDDVPMPTFYSDMVEEHRTKILSASPFVKFMQPYLLIRAREQERRLAYLKRLRDQDFLEEQKVDEKPKVEKFDLIKPEMVHEIIPNAPRKVREVLHAVHDAEYDKALHIYQTQTKQWETYIAGSIDLFDPYAHQSIAVLYSVVCTITTVPCSGPDLVALGFYNEHETDADFEADCTLGQYVEDLCLGANTVCTSNGCEKTMMEHHRQYVHGEVQISMFVERYPCKIQDMQESILMWSTCRICEKETPTMLMSENTWKYSFGKYLELSFWSSDMKARGDTCPHDLHRDHLRYFGYRNMALRVHYDPITLLEIIVPRARITWKVDNDLRFKNDIFTRIEDRMNRYMLSVRARIKSINTESVITEKVEACKEEVERLSKKAADEHHHLVQKLRKRYMNSKHYEIIPLNRAIRATQEKVAEWDNTFADFDRNFLPSEKDIRRLAALQLKRIFMEGDDSGKPAGPDGHIKSDSHETLTEKSANGDTLAPQTRDMSPEKADKLLASVVEKHVGGDSLSGETEEFHPTAKSEISDESTTTMTDAAMKESAQPSDLFEKPEPPKGIHQEPNSDLTTSLDSAAMMKNDLSKTDDPDSVDDELSSTKQGPKRLEIRQSISVPLSDRSQTSSIPRPVELPHRMGRPNPTTSSAYPDANSDTVPSNNSNIKSGHDATHVEQPSQTENPALVFERISSTPKVTKSVEKKLSERLGLTALKAGGAVAQSMIPRSIGGNKTRVSKVSSLAKHFEQLSREFERERIKERRQRQARSGQSRAYPISVSKPIVQVYRNVHEAVEEKEPSEEELASSDPSQQDQEEHVKTSQAMAEKQAAETPGEGFHAEGVAASDMEVESTVNDESRTGSDGEGRDADSDEDYTVFDDLQVPGTSDEHHALTEQEAQLDLRLDLPKHEKSSILKMLTNFWAERTASGWQPLDYPLNATDHIFADSDIIVREDEPSSLIALALNSEDYQSKLSSISDCTRASSFVEKDGEKQDLPTGADDQVSVEQSLLRPTGTHLKYQFSESSARMLCKVFYAEQFDAVRRKCGVSERFVESLSRCMKWDSKGGKTKSVFLKTLDDRFVLKSLSPIETQAFLRFAPAYFRIMSESLFHELPSVIAKMLGFYQVIIKNPTTGVEFNWFLLVMENLFYDRSPTRIFDLKGSMRNRRIQSTGEQNEVLLDENMVEFIYESPLFSREHSKKLLRASVWNDTLFLARQNVMDYSLMIAIDENRKELVVGIIDCIRTYTWDKKLESWIKDRGKNRPTVTSPKEYKSRFREAMGRYVLQAPNCWHQFEGRQQSRARYLSVEDPGDEKEGQGPDP